MLKLLKYFKPKEWIMCVIVVATIVGQVWLEMRLIRYMGEIVSLIQNHASGIGQLSAEILWGVGWKMLACAGLMLIAAIFVNFLASMIAAGFSKRLRFETFKKVNNFSN